jgi:hypothetical protein
MGKNRLREKVLKGGPIIAGSAKIEVRADFMIFPTKSRFQIINLQIKLSTSRKRKCSLQIYLVEISKNSNKSINKAIRPRGT